MSIQVTVVYLLSLFLLGISIQALGNPDNNRDVERIIVTARLKDTVKTTIIKNLNDTLRSVRFQLKHPDKVINPKMVVANYSGLTLKSLLIQAGLSEEQLKLLSSETITFVGRDSYSVAVPLADALVSNATLVGYENDTRLNWRRGAPFLSFLETNSLSYLAEPSWWAWWVSAIVVGNPDAVLEIGKRQFTSQQLAKVCKDTIQGTLNYPRGRRKIEPPKKNKGQLTQCLLSSLLQAETDAKRESPRTYVVDFLNGQQQKINEPESFVLVSKFNGQSIDAQMGGPLQLCDLKAKQECRYFVTAIREER